MSGYRPVTADEAIAAVNRDLPKKPAAVFAGLIRSGVLLPEQDDTGRVFYTLSGQSGEAQ